MGGVTIVAAFVYSGFTLQLTLRLRSVTIATAAADKVITGAHGIYADCALQHFTAAHFVVGGDANLARRCDSELGQSAPWRLISYSVVACKSWVGS